MQPNDRHVPEQSRAVPVPTDPYADTPKGKRTAILVRVCGYCGELLGRSYIRVEPKMVDERGEVETTGMCQPACEEARAMLGRFAT
jgi:hypothetical protein